MKKIILATALSLTLPAIAQAADPAPDYTLTGNLGVFSSYRFRGIDQTFGKPALQGGIDFAHSSGFYVGNWNSNVSEGAGFPSGNLEMDFYGGYKASFGDFGIDVGAIYYYYPGSDASFSNGTQLTNAKTTKTNTGTVSNKEIYIGGSWKFLSLKYYHSIDDYFSIPGTKNSHYLDLSASYDLGDGWGINGHVGNMKLKDYSNGVSDGDYTDWKIGVTKDLSGWVIGLSYIDTNANGSCSKGEAYCFGNKAPFGNSTKTKDAGRGIGVISVSKSF